jgi:hypothetical protein
MPRKGWKTPSYQGSGRICRPLFIPNDPQWLAAVGGALAELARPYNWEQVGITPQRASEMAAEMLLRFYTEECGGGTGVPITRIYRRGTRGQVQFSEDGGETWSDESELGVFPPVPPRSEPTPDDKRCLAARNAVEVLRLVYLELLEKFNEDSSVQYGIAAFATILGLLIAALAGAPILIITALINFAIEAFASAYGLFVLLGDDDWTPRFQEELVCLFYDNATVDPDGAVKFDYVAIRDNLSTLYADAALIAWMWYMMSVIGEEGINHAGATTSIDSYNCGYCGCTPGCNLLDAYYYASALKTMVPPYTLPLAGGEPFLDLRGLPPGRDFDIVLPERRCIKQIQMRLYDAGGAAGYGDITIGNETVRAYWSGSVWHTPMWTFSVPAKTDRIHLDQSGNKWGVHWARIWWCEE